MGEIRALLKSPIARMITVLGAPGVGKTSLARHGAQSVAENFPDGVCYVPAGAMGLPSLLMWALGRAFKLEISAQSDSRSELLRQMLRRRALLILDDAGRFPEAKALARDLLEACPFLKVLATGEEPLGLTGERCVSLNGLNVTENSESGLAGSVDLFIAVARKADPKFQLSAFDRPHASRICGLLQGNPLSIELAAGMLQMLSARELCKAIEEDPALALRMAQGSAAQGLDAVLSQCWSLLHSDRRQGLERLSIFEGAFTRDAAEKVAGVGFALLGLLSTKGLIQREAGGRCLLPPAIRNFARHRLASSPNAMRGVQEAHAAYFGAWLEGLDDQLRLHTALEHLGDLRALWLDRCLRQDCAWLSIHVAGYHQLLASGGSYYELTEDFVPALEAMELPSAGGVEDGASLSLRAQLLRGLGGASLPLGQPVAGGCYLLEAIEALRLLGPDYSLQRRETMGTLLALSARFSEVQGLKEALETELEDCKRDGDLAAEADALRLLGLRAGLAGQGADAKRYLAQSCDLLRKLGDRVNLVWSLGALGDRALSEGDMTQARQCADEILQMAEATGDKAGRIWARQRLAEILMHAGDAARASTLLKESLALCDAGTDKWTWGFFSNKVSEALRLAGDHQGAMEHAKGSLDAFSAIHEGWGQAWAGHYLGYAKYLSGQHEAGFTQLEAAAASLRPLENSSSLIVCLGHLAEARLDQGDLEPAWAHAKEALLMAMDNARLTLPERLDAVMNVALVKASRPGPEAAPLLSYLIHQPALSQRSRGRAAQALAKLRAGMPSADQSLAEVRAKRLDPASAAQAAAGLEY